jgi:glucokinase
MSKFIGIDIGGTGTRLVVANENHEVSDEFKIATSIFSAPSATESVSLLGGWIIKNIPDLQSIEAIGIGSTGPVNLVTGVIDNPDTLPQFSGLDLGGQLSNLLNKKVWIDNDANAAGLSEAILGAGKNYSSVLCITIGTGLGVSLFKDGQPIRALDGQHPEGGHIAVPNIQAPCYCGLEACWEMSASRLALEELAKSRKEFVLKDGRCDFSKLSESTWREFGYRIADGLISHLIIFRPEIVVICGSIIDEWNFFQKQLMSRLEMHRGFSETKNVQPSTIGDLSGALGATMLAQYKIGKGAEPL